MRRTLALLAALAALAGCPGEKPEGDLPPLHPARGTVVRAGQPVAGGALRFQARPDAPDLMVTAEVKPDGTFAVQTIHALSQKKGDGAPAGTYKATYTPPQGGQGQGGGGLTPVTLPETYTVKDGPNDLTIELGKK